jgi:hypothetical protein
MTSLSIALFLIFVLYLIDKNNVWRHALKVVVGIAALGVIVIAGIYGWARYVQWRTANAEQAAQQLHKRLVDACVARYSTSGYANSGPWAKYVDVKASCEENPNNEWDAKSDDVRRGNVVEIRGGDTLQITPPQKFTQGSPDFVPTIFLGNHQVYDFECGNSNEKKVKIESIGTFLTCK